MNGNKMHNFNSLNLLCIPNIIIKKNINYENRLIFNYFKLFKVL
jgi:hypothetical protein